MIDIIFLDFDGVIHPLFPRTDRSAQDNQLFSYLDLALDTINALPASPKIVVSSDWRKKPDYLNRVPAKLASRVFSNTGVLDARYDGVREDEALMWISKNYPGLEHKVRWMALDDVPELWRTKDKVIVCDDGFRAKEQHELLTTYNEKLNLPVITPNGIIL